MFVDKCHLSLSWMWILARQTAIIWLSIIKSMSLCSVSKNESDSSNSVEDLRCDALNSVINDLSIIVGMCFHFHIIQTQ